MSVSSTFSIPKVTINTLLTPFPAPTPAIFRTFCSLQKSAKAERNLSNLGSVLKNFERFENGLRAGS